MTLLTVFNHLIPRQLQVNEPLSNKNYTDWIQEMENFLFAKNNIGFIDDTIVKP